MSATIEPGAVFGRLTVLGPSKDRSKHWHCRCACGRETVVAAGNLRGGHSASCGCLRRDRIREAVTTHGYARQDGEVAYEYAFWLEMRKNCSDPSRDGYQSLGAKGIRVHPAWEASFEQFLADVGTRPDPELFLVLGRKNKRKRFAPGNVAWMTPGQRQLRKSDMREVTIGGVTKQLCEWAKESGISKTTLHWRLEHWPEERWLEPPAERLRRRRRPAVRRRRGSRG